jgi:tRNA G46 methylase TrmB
MNFSGVYLRKKRTTILGIEIGKDTLEDALKKLKGNQENNIYKIENIAMDLEEKEYVLDVYIKDGSVMSFYAKDKTLPIDSVFVLTNIYY